MNAIYIAFGANLSNPKQTFTAAIKALRSRGVIIVEMSGLWQSPAWPPGSDQPDYINACASVRFDGQAIDLLSILHEVEAEFGRKRDVKNAARSLDLDLLDFNGEIIDIENITVPHPRMLGRGFVLFPLEEIAPYWADPIHHRAIIEYIARLPLNDVNQIRRVGRF